MIVDFKRPSLGYNISIVLILTFMIIGFAPILNHLSIEANQLDQDLRLDKGAKIQGNTLIAVSNPNIPDPNVARKVNVVITAYSSTVEETDDTPFITAMGTQTRDGIIANNLLPFGTKVRIPELYGDKIFIVEDRMSWKKGDYHFDIWLPSHKEAEDFGVEWTYIEILKS
jgi:3D (Asp-Asp-Asp) domain-containing protein